MGNSLQKQEKGWFGDQKYHEDECQLFMQMVVETRE
jgi:hypothetical protein